MTAAVVLHLAGRLLPIPKKRGVVVHDDVFEPRKAYAGTTHAPAQRPVSRDAEGSRAELHRHEAQPRMEQRRLPAETAELGRPTGQNLGLAVRMMLGDRPIA